MNKKTGVVLALAIAISGLMSWWHWRSETVRGAAVLTVRDLYSSLEDGSHRRPALSGNAKKWILKIEERYGAVVHWRIESVACKPITGEWVAELRVQRSSGTYKELIYCAIGEAISSVSSEPSDWPPKVGRSFGSGPSSLATDEECYVPRFLDGSSSATNTVAWSRLTSPKRELGCSLSKLIWDGDDTIQEKS